MKERIKAKWINICFNENIDLFVNFALILTVLYEIAVIVMFRENRVINAFGLASEILIIGATILLIDEFRKALRRAGVDVINKNNMIKIAFSDRKFVNIFLTILVVLPILIFAIFTHDFLKLKLLPAIFLSLILAAILGIISEKIADAVKKRLV